MKRGNEVQQLLRRPITTTGENRRQRQGCSGVGASLADLENVEAEPRNCMRLGRRYRQGTISCAVGENRPWSKFGIPSGKSAAPPDAITTSTAARSRNTWPFHHQSSRGGYAAFRIFSRRGNRTDPAIRLMYTQHDPSQDHTAHMRVVARHQSQTLAHYALLSLPSPKSMLTLLTQCRSSVGVAYPSPLNTCPKWPPQLLHTISVRSIPNVLSVCLVTAPGIASKKAGHPHPELNLCCALYSGALQATHE